MMAWMIANQSRYQMIWLQVFVVIITKHVWTQQYGFFGVSAHLNDLLKMFSPIVIVRHYITIVNPACWVFQVLKTPMLVACKGTYRKVQRTSSINCILSQRLCYNDLNEGNAVIKFGNNCPLINIFMKNFTTKTCNMHFTDRKINQEINQPAVNVREFLAIGVGSRN